MRRFQQILEDQYNRLGLTLEQEDDTEKDNEAQKAELDAVKQKTDAAEDESHAAQTDAHASRQELAGAQTKSAQNQAVANRQKTKNIKV